MYYVLDVSGMLKASPTARKRNKPLKDKKSVIMLRPGTIIDMLPPNTEIRRVGDVWEAHMDLSNKVIVKRLAKHLNAIAWQVV